MRPRQRRGWIGRQGADGGQRRLRGFYMACPESPVIVNETSDNSGAGGPCDGTWLRRHAGYLDLQLR
jgi:microcystin degradation protein MlrC